MNNQLLQTLSVQAFQKAYFKGQAHRLFSKIKKQAASLLVFDDVIKRMNITSRHYAGLKTVGSQFRGHLDSITLTQKLLL